MPRIHDRIRDILESTPGLTQKGLAERMGLNPAAVNRMLHGRRNIMAEEIPVIESYLGRPLDISDETATEKKRGGFSDMRQAAITDARGARLTDNVPVIRDGKIVDWVPRHPAQSGIEKAFAVYIGSDAMQPRYYRGELVYVHPGRPLEPGRDCLIEFGADGKDEPIVRRLLQLEEGRVRVQQFNPSREKEIPAKDIRAMYTIVGRG